MIIYKLLHTDLDLFIYFYLDVLFDEITEVFL